MGRNYSATAVDTTLAGAITSTATSLTVTAASGFPSTPFIIAVIDSPGVQEIMLVTAVNGTTFTVTRGYDLTTAAAHPASALVRHVASAIDFREGAQHRDATSGVHGVGAGFVVGTSTPQALTFKDLSSSTNTFPTFITGFLVPTGAGMEWPSTAPAPAGWLKQDGGEYPIATYTALYNFLTNNGTVFPFGPNTNGSGGAGSTHFRTPRRQGVVAVGYDAADGDFNAIGKTGGAKTVTLTQAQIPSHTHGMSTTGAHAHTMVAAGAHAHTMSIAGSHVHSVNAGGSHSHTIGSGGNHSHAVQNAGSHSHGGTTHWAGDHAHTYIGQALQSGMASGGSVYYAARDTYWTSTGGNHYHGISADGDHNHTIVEAGSHTHTLSSDGSHIHSVNAAGAHDHVIDSNGTHSHAIDTAGDHAHVNAATGGGEAHSNLQPHIVMNYIIKT